MDSIVHLVMIIDRQRYNRIHIRKSVAEGRNWKHTKNCRKLSLQMKVDNSRIVKFAMMRQMIFE